MAEEAGRWPATLSREQFINALEQFLGWVEDELDGDDLPTMHYGVVSRQWVDPMDAIQPCWPGEEGGQ